MTLLFDQDIPEPVVAALRAVRFPFYTVDEGEVPGGKDKGVMERALALNCAILVTRDLGMYPQAYYHQYTQNGLTVVQLRWKRNTNKDFQEMLLAILRDCDSWESFAKEGPSIISVNRKGSRRRDWQSIPTSIATLGQKISG